MGVVNRVAARHQPFDYTKSAILGRRKQQDYLGDPKNSNNIHEANCKKGYLKNN